MSSFAAKFPRVRRHWLDLETAGLQTPSYLWGVHPGASEYGPAISEFAFGSGTRTGRVHGFTDLVGPETLAGVTPKMLRRGGNLPEELLERLTGDGPKHWDRSVGDKGVLSGVFRRHARHVMKGRKTTNLSSLVEGMLGHLERDISKGRTPELLGWNITGFDLPTIHGQLRLLSTQTGSDALLKRFEGTMSKVRVREASEAYHALLYKHMLKTNFMPVISNRAAMNAAAGRGIKAFTDVAHAKKAGALTGHTSLRAFMDDVKAHVSGKSAFQTRAQNWASQFMGTAEANAVGRAMQEQLSTIGGDLESFYGTARRLTQSRGKPLMAGISHSAFDVMNMMYQPAGQGHMNILTSPDLLGVATHTPVTALQFAGGAKQGQVGTSFLQAAKDVGYENRDLAKLKRRLLRGHVAETDRQAVKLLHRALNSAPSNVMDRMAEIHLEVGHAEKLGLQRLNENMMDLVRRSSHERAASAAARGAEEGVMASTLKEAAHAAKTGARELLAHTPRPWLMMGAAAAGLVFLAERNKPKAPIQGLRDPHSDYRQVEGIRGSDLPFANVSGFGSGYDHDSFMGPNQVKITRVIDGDTVQFYRKGKLITGRLAGINAAETSDLADYIRRDALKAKQYLSELVQQQNVWVRQQVGDPMDVYGRELVFLDVGGMNVNAEMVRQGYSAASRPMPEPYYGPGDFVGRLKYMMKTDTEAAIAWIKRGPLGGIVPFSSALPDHASRPDYFDTPLEQYSDNLEPTQSLLDHPNDNTNGSGYAGLSFNMFENANMSKIRDQATQLGRLPGLPRTPRGRMSHSGFGHSEMAAFRNG